MSDEPREDAASKTADEPPTLAERVTAYVDGVLSEQDRAEVETLLAERPDLRAQADAERSLRERLRALPAPEPRPGFEMQVRTALRAERRRSRARWLLPLAALLLVGLWARGLPGFVALAVARDHKKCFGLEELPAKVWSEDPVEIAAWFEKQGTVMPPLPAGASRLQLVGARYCPLGDRNAAHVYYAGQRHHLSLFVVPGPVRFEGEIARQALGQQVRFLRSAGVTVALVSDEAAFVDGFAKEFSRTLASLDPP